MRPVQDSHGASHEQHPQQLRSFFCSCGNRKRESAGASKTKYGYDRDATKQSQADPNGNVTMYNYDAAAPLTALSKGCDTANAATASYGYDDAGNQSIRHR